MKEEIARSVIKTGELNNSLAEAQDKIIELENKLKDAKKALESSPSSELNLKNLQEKMSEIQHENSLKSKRLTADSALISMLRSKVISLGGDPDMNTVSKNPQEQD